MTFSQYRLLYRLVAHNQRLQSRRHPMFEKNMVLRAFGYFFIAFWAVYLMMLGFSAFTLYDGTSLEAFDWIDGGMIWFLFVDFLTRFALQDTPAQNIKQYKLLPIPTGFLLHTFLLRMGLQPYNLFWAFFFVPFGIRAIPQFYGIVGLTGFLVGWWLMYVLNSYWYLLWRTLINRNYLFLIVPLCVYVGIAYFGVLYDGENAWLFSATALLMRGFCQWNAWCWVLFVAIVLPLYVVNYRMQKSAIYVEIAKVDKVRLFKSRDMACLDRCGVVGEYLKLEVKSAVRNLVVRKQFITGALCMLMLCASQSFSGIYDEVPLMRVFICVYCFTCLGVMTLTTVMCAEGNYIDGLMVRRETVLALLRAKYYFHCLLLIVPLLFSLMPVAEGKVSWLTVLGCMFFTSGVVFPFLFQLAVYNDTTIHLNARLTRRGHDTRMQMFLSGASLFVPMLLMYVMIQCFNDTIAAIAMMIPGIAGTLFHPLWLRHIYRRFMKRRYANLEGFRNSR